MKRKLCCAFVALCLISAGCDNGAKERQEILKALDEQNKAADARILALAVERIELVHGRAARAHAELDLMNGGSVYQVEKAPCQSSVYVDGHLAGTVAGCEKHTEYGQTTTDNPYCIFSLPPKKDGGAYTITVKRSGYKPFEMEVKPQEKHGYVNMDATMQKL